MVNVSEIVDGYKNWLVRTPTTEKESQRRTEICSNCDLSKNILGIATCTGCNCPLAVKTRSALSECPHPKGNKW
jgi:uncharacterized paraquat-inducible protein A